MILNVIQIILSVTLIIVILIQHRGSGLGSAFGGDSSVYKTKRGVEKSLHYATIVIAILFIAISLVNFLK